MKKGALCEFNDRGSIASFNSECGQFQASWVVSDSFNMCALPELFQNLSAASITSKRTGVFAEMSLGLKLQRTREDASTLVVKVRKEIHVFFSKSTSFMEKVEK